MCDEWPARSSKRSEVSRFKHHAILPMLHPLLYEINTRCWLPELSAKCGQPITLANVPDSEFADWQRLGLTHIWLMGVWTSGPRARAEALANPQLQVMYSEALPDWRDEDVGGSPY